MIKSCPFLRLIPRIEQGIDKWRGGTVQSLSEDIRSLPTVAWAFLFIALRVNNEENGDANCHQDKNQHNGEILPSFFGWLGNQCEIHN
jgi:hypothetical protein